MRVGQFSLWVVLCAFNFVVLTFADVAEVCSNENGQCQSTEQVPKIKIAKGSNEQGAPPAVSYEECEDRAEPCPRYAAAGECEKNPGWMIVNCPHSCNACHLRDYKARCSRSFLNISTEPVYKPFEMGNMFSSISERFGDRYDINVLSTSPWVVTFDNFLTDEEAEALISTVEGTWEHSTDTGAVNAFGETGRTLSKGRTSSNAWCKEKCSSHSLVQNVVSKMAEVTLVPSNHYESLQILHYEKGQFYRKHHDMGL
jgi:prolyl 4-hydroxylase